MAPQPRLGPYRFAGGTALVTGAASGIGAALAAELAARGSSLVLLDVDRQRLTGVADAVRGRHPALRVAEVVTDLADAEQTRATGERLAADHPDLTLVVNNAGVALGGTFTQVSADDFDWLLTINLGAVVRLTRALLPVLLRHPGSHLVNVSSVFGLISPAGQSAYTTSKFAVRGFTECLRAELAGSGVGVSTVFPGGIRTRIAESARAPADTPADVLEAQRRTWERLLTIPPQRAAAVIADGVARRRPRILIGATAALPDVVARLSPAHHPGLLARLTRS